MLVIFFRAIILYLVVFVSLRIMGKKEMSKIQPFELAIIILMADLASAPMSSREISIFEGIIPIFALLICYTIFSIIMLSSNKAEEVICGKLNIIIEDGKINEKELKKNEFSISDIMAQLRKKKVFKVQDVKFATIETNGELNIITIDQDMSNIPLNVIEDGKLNTNNIELLNLTEEKVKELVKEKEIKIKNILIGTIDENQSFLYQLKEGDIR